MSRALHFRKQLLLAGPAVLLLLCGAGYLGLRGAGGSTERVLFAACVAPLLLVLLAAGCRMQRELLYCAETEQRLHDAQAHLTTRLEEQRVTLSYALGDLLRQIVERRSAEEEIRHLNLELEKRVRDRTAELEEANRELEAFTYSVSHDLRAPLRHMEGFSRILLEDCNEGLTPEMRRHLDRIREATQHMHSLVEDLLDLSRIGRQPAHLQPCSLQQIVNEAISLLQPEASGRQIDWRIAALPELEADPGLLRQVLANLLQNALKFTRPRALAVIEVGCIAQDDELVVLVRDNGVGFDPRYASKLFGVFQRLHTDQEFEGTGIGLATVQRIIHKHGGRVWAEAQPGAGATFYFSLPAPRQRAEIHTAAIGALA
jgi:light-regulated signal transduction histidine kinase (bacteriophytochrome)